MSAPPALIDAGQRLLEALPGLLGEHHPEASLLHGDLWAGNFASGPRGDPVIFDPAVHYGDRECDLAMTRLFGGGVRWPGTRAGPWTDRRYIFGLTGRYTP